MQLLHGIFGIVILVLSLFCFFLLRSMSSTAKVEVNMIKEDTKNEEPYMQDFYMARSEIENKNMKRYKYLFLLPAILGAVLFISSFLNNS